MSATGKMNRFLLRSAVVAALGGLLFGFDTVVIAGAEGSLKKMYELSAFWEGFTVASALLGTVLGSMFAGIPSDRFGRKACLRALAVLYVVTAVGCAVAPNWHVFIFFRLLGGLAIGGSSVIGPMYIAEIAPAVRRGRLVGLFQFNIVTGILLAYLSNYLVGMLGLGSDEWRWKLGLAAIPAALFFLTLQSIPQSPRWLVRQGRKDEARDVFVRIGDDNPDEEIRDIAESISAEATTRREPLFQYKYRFPIFLAISIGMFNQLTGINALLYYVNKIFESAGASKEAGDLRAVAIGLTNFLCTIIAMTVIDRLGRKKLLLIGAAGTAACLGAAAAFANGRNETMLFTVLVGFIGFFAFSQGAVIWVYLSEVFPNTVRAKGQSLGSFTHWIMNALISWVFPLMTARSVAVPFIFFSAMTVLQFFVVLFVYPETKGITLEKMQKELGIK